MIDLVTAALIAKIVSDAVGAFDKNICGIADAVKKKEPAAVHLPPPDYAYVNKPSEKAFLAPLLVSRGLKTVDNESSQGQFMVPPRRFRVAGIERPNPGHRLTL
jgi:hypothetical protein